MDEADHPQDAAHAALRPSSGRPDPARFGGSLADAAKAANKGCRARVLVWTAADTEALLKDVASAPEGLRQWNGPGDRKHRTETRSAVAVSWWTDPVKRTHYRI